MTAELPASRRWQTTFAFDGSPRRIELDMEVGELTETVTVTGEARQ